MKADIHPKWYPEAKVVCAGCANTFTVGSTVPEIHVDVCSNCHPFYTGQMRYIDTAGRVDRFKTRLEKARQKTTVSKKERRHAKKVRKIQEELTRPTSLKELRKSHVSHQPNRLP